MMMKLKMKMTHQLAMMKLKMKMTHQLAMMKLKMKMIQHRKGQVVVAANLPQQQQWVLESAAAIPARIAGSIVQMDLDYRATYDGQRNANQQQTETNRYV